MYKTMGGMRWECQGRGSCKSSILVGGNRLDREEFLTNVGGVYNDKLLNL